MDDLALDAACHAAFRLIDATNEYIASSEPWTLARDGRDAELDTVLWTAAEALRVAAVLLSPVMPTSCETILGRLGAPVREAGALRLERDATLTSSGTRQLTRGAALWPRLEPAAPPVTTKETAVTDTPTPAPQTPAAPAAPAAAASPTPAAEPRLSIDEFMKVDLRVARIVTAERVPNSRKLMKLSVDLGTETRTIVAGIADAYEAEALVGRTVVIVANLKPAKLMGVESNGMVLAASPDGGKPMLLGLDEPLAPGTRVR